MEQHDRLKAWMTEKGYSYVTLAQELDFSETYIFKLMSGTKPLNSAHGFLLKFSQRFGTDEANKLFDLHLRAEVLL